MPKFRKKPVVIEAALKAELAEIPVCRCESCKNTAYNVGPLVYSHKDRAALCLNCISNPNTVNIQAGHLADRFNLA